MSAHPSTETVWSQLGDDLRRFIRRRVRDEHIADDLLQETFLRIHRGIGALQDSDRLAAWVYRIARNVIHDHDRKGTATASNAFEEFADDEERHSSLKCRAGTWLAELIAELSEKYRGALQLAEIDGLSQREVADRLGLSLPAAKSRVQRGRSLLKDALDRCCAISLDRRGNVMDVDPRPERTVCLDCDECA